jgi:LytR_cpsA_psr family
MRESPGLMEQRSRSYRLMPPLIIPLPSTVEKDYGVTIDRYAWVGLSGFASVIDTLGGVDIDVTHPIVDDAYPADTGA